MTGLTPIYTTDRRAATRKRQSGKHCNLRPPRIPQNRAYRRRIGAPHGAPVAPPSTINSTALMYEESSEARKSAALATSSGSPQRPSGIAEETNFANFSDSSVEIEARGPRFQMGVFVAPGATTFTRMLRGARSAAMARAIETTPPLVAAYAATPGWPR